MAYSDFSLAQAIDQFSLDLYDRPHHFAPVPPINPSDRLRELLQENVPLALASNTEKARSEWIIAPILVELRRQLAGQISLFSGIDFDIDPSCGLNGRCDFLVARSPELLLLKSPVTVLVEAKRENINSSLGQCVAEVVAAWRFNQQANDPISSVYGVVTTGTTWKFLGLHDRDSRLILEIDLDEYYLNQLDRILGILTFCVTGKAP